MSKLRCPCGCWIADQTDDLSCKGEVFADQDAERLWGAAAATLASLLAADGPGGRRQWVSEHTGYRGSGEADGEALVGYLLARISGEVRRRVYECGACGRLLLQAAPGVNRYLAYAPDEPGSRGVLRAASPGAAPDGSA